MSRTPLNIIACVAAASLGLTTLVEAGTVQFQLGEQDFADGMTPIYSRQIRAAGAGEMFPFDGTIFGHDLKSGPNTLGTFEYAHTFGFGVGVRPVSATLTIGLIDIDSTPDSPLETVSLSFDGFGQPTDLLTGISAMNAKSSVEVIDIPVPVEFLDDGMLNVRVTALRPGYANLGNAIEADFSRLVVQVEPVTPDPVIIPDLLPPPPIDPDDGGGPQPIPLPPALIPAAVLLAGIAAAPKRRLRRWLRV